MRIADVALFYGERGGGIRTYLEAKANWARRTGAIEHHLVVPGRGARSAGGRHELPSVRVTSSNGYRVPLGGLRETLATLAADVVVLHDPYWTPRAAARAAHEGGALVLAAHHSSVALHAASLPLRPQLWTGPLRRWYRRAYRDVDGVLSVLDPEADTGRPLPVLPLRLGLDTAFRPRPRVARGAHALYAGRLAREKGVGELVDAAARGDWELVLQGAGPHRAALQDRASALDTGRRVRFEPYVAGRAALAHTFCAAGCVVLPGPHETFGLVALEAAACGAPVVVADTAPAERLLGELGHRFRAGDHRDLARAIGDALRAPRRLDEAWALARRHGWDAAFAAELADVRGLLAATAPQREAVAA